LGADGVLAFGRLRAAIPVAAHDATYLEHALLAGGCSPQGPVVPVPASKQDDDGVE
jgi:hypothetical protein